MILDAQFSPHASNFSARHPGGTVMIWLHTPLAGKTGDEGCH
jgi:hypothetical protein